MKLEIECEVKSMQCKVTDGPYGPIYDTFFRYGPDNWTVMMGQSEEMVNPDYEEELEAAYQAQRDPTP